MYYEVEMNEIDRPLYLTEKQLDSLLIDVCHGDKEKVELFKGDLASGGITTIRTAHTRAVITRIEL